MIPHRKAVRDKLKRLNSSDIERLLNNAALNPTSDYILRLRFIKHFSICKIALLLHYSEGTVRNFIKDGYDSISKL